MSAANSHTHQDLEDRITAEIAGMHTEIVALRVEIRRGFSHVTQVLGQILGRLPGDDTEAGA
jgi:hypothetical protein